MGRKKRFKKTSGEGFLGEWIFVENKKLEQEIKVSVFVESETKFAVQKNWKTPSLFPCCPNSISENPISSYNLNLKTGLIFPKNYFSTSIIQDFAISENQQKLWVFCKTSETGTLKPWSLAEITF